MSVLPEPVASTITSNRLSAAICAVLYNVFSSLIAVFVIAVFVALEIVEIAIISSKIEMSSSVASVANLSGTELWRTTRGDRKCWVPPLRHR